MMIINKNNTNKIMIIRKPLCPEVTLPLEGFKLPPDFDIMFVLRQFPRDSAVAPQDCEYSTFN